MAIEDTIDNMLDLERRSLQRLKDGEVKDVPSDAKMFISSAIQWKIDLLEELKSELE